MFVMRLPADFLKYEDTVASPPRAYLSSISPFSLSQARHDARPVGEFMSVEVEAEWGRKRTVYAATGVDTPEEAAAAREIIGFAELHGHPAAACYVGHWHYHGEAGVAQSDLEALRWYERAAKAGDASAAAARDKMYLDGKGCGPGTADSHARAVTRLRDIMTPLGNRSGDASPASPVPLPGVVVRAAQQRLLGWGYSDVAGNDASAGDSGGESAGYGSAGEKPGSSKPRSPTEASSGEAASSAASRERLDIAVPARQSGLRLDLESSLAGDGQNAALAAELAAGRERHRLLAELRILEGAGGSNAFGAGGALVTATVTASPPASTDPYGGAFDAASGFGYGVPPRRGTATFTAGRGASRGSGEVDSSTAGSGLRSASDVAAALPPNSAPVNLEEASVEGALALRCILASRSYDEYMQVLEHAKSERSGLGTVPGKKWRVRPQVLLPDDAVTYGIYARAAAREGERLASLCDPTTVATGSGFRLPVQRSEFTVNQASLRDRQAVAAAKAAALAAAPGSGILTGGPVLYPQAQAHYPDGGGSGALPSFSGRAGGQHPGFSPEEASRKRLMLSLKASGSERRPEGEAFGLGDGNEGVQASSQQGSQQGSQGVLHGDRNGRGVLALTPAGAAVLSGKLAGGPNTGVRRSAAVRAQKAGLQRSIPARSFYTTSLATDMSPSRAPRALSDT